MSSNFLLYADSQLQVCLFDFQWIYCFHLEFLAYPSRSLPHMHQYNYPEYKD
jgi:hypothetical protein